MGRGQGGGWWVAPSGTTAAWRAVGGHPQSSPAPIAARGSPCSPGAPCPAGREGLNPGAAAGGVGGVFLVNEKQIYISRYILKKRRDGSAVGGAVLERGVEEGEGTSLPGARKIPGGRGTRDEGPEPRSAPQPPRSAPGPPQPPGTPHPRRRRAPRDPQPAPMPTGIASRGWQGGGDPGGGGGAPAASLPRAPRSSCSSPCAHGLPFSPLPAYWKWSAWQFKI